MAFVVFCCPRRATFGWEAKVTGAKQSAAPDTGMGPDVRAGCGVGERQLKVVKKKVIGQMTMVRLDD